MDMATRMAEDGFKDVGYKYVSIDVRFDNFWLKFIIICCLVYLEKLQRSDCKERLFGPIILLVLMYWEEVFSLNLISVV